MSRFKKLLPGANSNDRLAQINSAAVTRLSSQNSSAHKRKRVAKTGFLSSVKNLIFIKPYLVFSIVIIALISPSIYAQIKNIYDAKDDNASGITSLMSAVASNDVSGVKFFAKAGPALVNQKNLGGATALHIAAREGNFEIVKILIDYGADVNSVDNENWTPLMRASISANKEIVDFLLTKGAQGSILNSSKESVLVHATSSDCNDCLSLLFEKFNFLQSMDVDALKSQLADAFVIARNHENQVAQDMIAAYLDRVSELAKASQQQSVNEETMISKKPYAGEAKKGFGLKSPKNASGSKFKFVGKQEKLSDEASEEKIVITKDEAPKDSQFKEVAIESVSTAKGKIYKFKVGPVGQKISKNNKKFIAPNQLKSEVKVEESTTKPEESVAKSEENKTSDVDKKSAKTPFNPLVSNSDEEVEKSASEVVAAKVYKLLAGPEGKKVKPKKIIKKPAPAQVDSKASVNEVEKAAEPAIQPSSVEPAVQPPLVAPEKK